MSLPRKRPLPECIYSDWLSPLPEQRRHHVDFDSRPPPKQERNWEVEVRRQFRAALENPTRLNDYSFVEHQARADKVLPAPGEAGWRCVPEVQLLDSKRPTAVVGSDDSLGLLYIPGFLHGVSLVNLTSSTEQHMRLELKSTTQQHSPSALRRHTGDVYHYDGGFAGVCHYGVWHARGHQHSNSFEPTRDTTRNSSNILWTSKIRFFDSNYTVDHRVNYLLRLARPDFATILQTARQRVMEHPGVLPFHQVRHTDFMGRAVVVNRETGEHLDVNGVRRAWDVIIAAGDFEGGDLYLRDMGIRCPLKPGDLVAFDGTAQRHQILEYTGRLRLSHVYFIHQSVLTELGIDSQLPDVYLSDLLSRIAQYACRPRVPKPLPPTQSLQQEREDTGLSSVRGPPSSTGPAKRPRLKYRPRDSSGFSDQPVTWR